MKPTAKSFVLDLLSTFRDQPMPVGALVAAGELLGIGDSGIRVAVARMLAAGQLERDAHGCHRLGRQSEPVARRVNSWRMLEELTVPWKGDWIAVHTAGLPARPRRKTLRHRRRALRMLGFESLDEGLSIRPGNLVADVDSIRKELHALGLEPGGLVFAVRDLDAATNARARSLWNVAGLCAGYARSLADIEASERQLVRLNEEEGLAETFLLGGRVIRQLVLDPLLPEPMIPTTQRAALIEAMRRYDRVARKLWSHFLEPLAETHRREQSAAETIDGADRGALH